MMADATTAPQTGEPSGAGPEAAAAALTAALGTETPDTGQAQTRESSAPEPEPTEAPKTHSQTKLLADLTGERQKRQQAEGQLKAVLAALGLGETGQVSPEEAARQARAEANNLRIELALRDAIPEGVNGPALLDSASLKSRIAAIADPTAEQVAEIVQQFVAENPWVQVQRPIPASRDLGSRGASETTTEDPLAAALSGLF